MKIKHHSKSNIHQRNMNTSKSASATGNSNDFEIKRRIITDHQQEQQPSSSIINCNDKSTKYSSSNQNYSTHGTIKCPSTSDTLIGFIPLILLIAILSCFVFGVFTIIKLAINHAYKEDYD